MLVLPTPPLPVTNTSRRSSTGHVVEVARSASVMGGVHGGRRRRGAWPEAQAGAEADAALGVGAAELDVGDAGRRDRHVLAVAVGEPERLVVVGEGLVDAALDLGAIGVGGQLDLDLLHRVQHADANVHNILQSGPLVGLLRPRSLRRRTIVGESTAAPPPPAAPVR